jgi:hypothetical protein
MLDSRPPPGVLTATTGDGSHLGARAVSVTGQKREWVSLPSHGGDTPDSIGPCSVVENVGRTVRSHGRSRYGRVSGPVVSA